MKSKKYLSFSFILILFYILMPINNYSQGSNGKAAAPSGQNTMEQRLADIEKKFETAKETYEVEKIATKKLIEISEKNLTAPNFIWYIIFGVISILAIIGGGAKHVYGHLKDDLKIHVNEQISEYVEKSTTHLDTFAEEMKTSLEDINKIVKEVETSSEKIDEELFEFVYNTYPREAYRQWKDKQYNRAIYFARRAMTSCEDKWDKEPVDFEKRKRLNSVRADLAYYLIESKNEGIEAEALEYANKALETGRDTKDISLIDTYLFVVMRLDAWTEVKDKKTWVKIYDDYNDRIKEVEEELMTPQIKAEYEKYFSSLTKDPRISTSRERDSI